MLKDVLSNEAVKFVCRFLIFYGSLYFFNYAYTGITAPGGYYNEWLDAHANYISGLRLLILKGASFMLTLTDHENIIQGYYLHIIGGKTIRMVYSCIGLNIIAVWWAFILAYPIPTLRRVLYIVTGTAMITLLNMVRIAAVTLSPKKGHFLNTPFDHHTVFNFVVYGCIITAIFYIINKTEKQAKLNADKEKN